MSRKVKITVAEPSAIIRGGLIALLGQMGGLHAEVSEIGDMEQLKASLGWQKPDILIIDPSSLGVFSMQQIVRDSGNPGLKCVALLTSLADGSFLKNYDETISLYDSADQIREKINKLVSDPDSPRRHESLSQREKEVVVCVIQGMTNKQIADKLCLSTHTVITHRRNISAKLDIHSTAGLTIYAIVNKLVDIEDIKDDAQ